ncbi:hypothetical protein QE152_g31301 [Popillia japonica]|uniref:Uncharacterized protein n=1 Tax=Popillia japonica TaxID=7064 RepID=A0AAW1JC31_POPJA
MATCSREDIHDLLLRWMGSLDREEESVCIGSDTPRSYGILLEIPDVYPLRHASVQKTVSELIKDWPILKLNNTQELIEEDFIAQYSSQANALLVK